MKIRRGPATVTGSQPRSASPLGNREGERGARSQETSRSCHHYTLGGGNGGDSGPAVAARIRPSSKPRGWAACLKGSSLRALALILGSLAACRPAAESPASADLVDDAGVPIDPAARPRRVVSLNPPTTELLFALAAAPRLVGRSSACDYPAEAARIPSLGGGFPPAIEAVVRRSRVPWGRVQVTGSGHDLGPRQRLRKRREPPSRAARCVQDRIVALGPV